MYKNTLILEYQCSACCNYIPLLLINVARMSGVNMLYLLATKEEVVYLHMCLIVYSYPFSIKMCFYDGM